MSQFSSVISFLPNATEIIYALGQQDRLKGVTHECNYPSEVKKKPVVIKPVIDFGHLNSIETDRKIKELSNNNKPIFEIDLEKIKQVKPDLIITQTTCSVCAPYDLEFQKVVEILGYTPDNLVLNPSNMNGILETIDIIGKKLGAVKKSKHIKDLLQKRINRIKYKLAEENQNHNVIVRDKILCLDWINPFYVAGHWIPEMVEISGGKPVMAKIDERSYSTSIEEIKENDPDKIILMPCGYDINKSKKEYDILKNSVQWNSLRAYKDRQIFIVNSNSYFSKPGPRITIGIEILAKIFHEKIFNELKIPLDGYIRL